MARGQLRIGHDDDTQAEDALADAMAAFGLVAEAPIELDEEFYLWPENEEVFWLWMAVQTQWDVADGVRYKLNYTGVEVVARAWRIGRREWGGIFSLLQVMERSCLDEWASNRR
jgi:hypothetical protein